MGITIIDVKIVGECSKHGGNMKYKDGRKIEDKDIECIMCGFESLESTKQGKNTGEVMKRSPK